MTIEEILKKIHIRYEKNTDYAQSGSEDLAIRIAYVNDALGNLEKEAREGVVFPFLITQTTLSLSGTGTDALPSDFLTFISTKEQPAVFSLGSYVYTNASSDDGVYLTASGVETGNLFWQEGTNMRTLPPASGDISLYYQKKLPRYETGSESGDFLLTDTDYIQEYVLAYLYLDDENLNQYNAHINNAKELLENMRNVALVSSKRELFGFGK